MTAEFKPLTDKSVERFADDGKQTVFAISPYGASETREQRIARWEAMGSIAPGCPSCREFYDHPTLDAFAPRHRASRYCRSGGRPHCTCDLCF